MDEEIKDLELDNSDQQDETPQQKENRSESRIKALNDQKTKAEKAREKAEAERESAIRESEFYKNFNTKIPQYQAAAEYQDKIKEKVMAGYDIDDAIVAVLNKEGKFTSNPQPIVRENPAGGSAVTNIPANGGDKSVAEMNQAERKAQLAEREAELRDLLSPKIRM